MRRPIIILPVVVVLAVLVGAGAYALMRDSGGEESKPESVAVQKSPQAVPKSTLTQGASTTPAMLPPGQEGESAEGTEGVAPAEETPQPQAMIAPYDPSWTPAPLSPNDVRMGNCLLPKDAVEVFPEAAVAAGGRAFDIPPLNGMGRCYSLPDGRCICLYGEKSPDWVPANLLTPQPGYEKRGNCVVPEGAVEVYTDAATAAGGRVFEYGEFWRYFSLPDGRCIPVNAGKPLPDWVPPDRLTPAPQPPAAPTPMPPASPSPTATTEAQGGM